jgi:hypothetical protein
VSRSGQGCPKITLRIGLLVPARFTKRIEREEAEIMINGTIDIGADVGE